MTKKESHEIDYSDELKTPDLVIGANVIAHLINVKYPLLLVDGITEFLSSPLGLRSQRYVSSNEPVFLGHFPEFKLWPGIYTIEGLRQSIYLLKILYCIDEAGLIKALKALDDQYKLKSHFNKNQHQNLFKFLKELKLIMPDISAVRVKLLRPVFAGCIINYGVTRQMNDQNNWLVEATIEGRLIAKGSIRMI